MCRVAANPEGLIRLALSPDGGEVVVDLKGRLPGRGAWLHSACVSAAPKRAGALGRHWGKVDLSAIPDQVALLLREAVLNGVSLAVASGALVGGFQVLQAALKDERVDLVVLASDVSDRTRRALSGAAHSDVLFVDVPVDKVELGARMGKGSRAAVGVTRSRSATHLRRQLRRLRSLG